MSKTLFAAPIPEECRSVGVIIQTAVKIAVQEAEVDGKDVTPWILKRIGELWKPPPQKKNSTSPCSCHTMASTYHFLRCGIRRERLVN